MTAILHALRWDVIVQARNGFYWASAFLIMVISALLLSVPETARANSALWVPAILVINLQITTFFFVAGLMLLERDEGMLNALAVSPLSPSGYLVMRTVSLTGLAAAETIAIVWIGFGTGGSWLPILGGTAALGVIYTGFGAAVATRYDSVNALLLPASAFVALLLLPLASQYLGYRVALPLLLGSASTLIGYSLTGLTPLALSSLLPIALVAGFSAPILALVLAIAAPNKVAGFAVVKVLNAVNLLPVVAYFVPRPLQFVAGIFPTYWPMRALWSAAAGESYLSHLVIGAVISAFALLLAVWLFDRRLLRRP